MRKPRPDKWLPLVPRESVINLREEIRDVLQDLGDAEHGIFEYLHPRHVRAKTDVHLHHHADAYDEELQVEVLAHLETSAQLETLLAGWPDHVDDADGLSWVRRRIQSSGARQV